MSKITLQIILYSLSDCFFSFCQAPTCCRNQCRVRKTNWMSAEGANRKAINREITRSPWKRILPCNFQVDLIKYTWCEFIFLILLFLFPEKNSLDRHSFLRTIFKAVVPCALKLNIFIIYKKILWFSKTFPANTDSYTHKQRMVMFPEMNTENEAKRLL